MSRTLAKAAAALLFLTGASPGTGDVDWKVYGTFTTDGVDMVCFYEAAGIHERSDHHLEVWTKCIRQADLNGIDIKKDFHGEIVKRTVGIMASGYQPPYLTLPRVPSNFRTATISYEVTADIAGIEPKSRFLREFDCPNRMERALSRYVDTIGSDEKPNQWAHVLPEGNDQALYRFVCKA